MKTEELIKTENSRLLLQEEHSRRLRKYKKQIKELEETKINFEKDYEILKITHDNLLSEVEDQTTSTILLKIKYEKIVENNKLLENELNKSSCFQCEVERLELLLKDKIIEIEDDKKIINLLQNEIQTLQYNSSNNNSFNSKEKKRIKKVIPLSDYNSSFIAIPTNLSLEEINDLLDDNMKKYPITIVKKDQLLTTSLDPTISFSNLNTSSTTPYYLVKWKSSILNYSEFYEKVIKPTNELISNKLSNNTNSQLFSLYYSKSPIETLLQQINHFPDFLPDDDEFGVLLLDNSISRETLYYWATNPTIKNKKLFDIFNGLTKLECLNKALELNSTEKIQDFNKNKYNNQINNERLKSKSRINISNNNNNHNNNTSNNQNDSNLSEFQHQILTYESELLSLVSRIDGRFPSLSQFIENLENQVNTLQNDNKSLLNDKEKIQNDLNNQLEDNRTLLKQLEKALIQLDQTEDKLKQEEKIKQLESEIQLKKQEFQTQQIIIQSHLESIVRLQSIEKDLKGENNQLKDDFNKLKEKYELLEIKNTLVTDISSIHHLLINVEQLYLKLLPQLNLIENHLIEENTSKSITEMSSYDSSDIQRNQMKLLILTEKIHSKLIEMEVVLSLLKGEKNRFLDNDKILQDIEKIRIIIDEINLLIQTLNEVENEREELLQKRIDETINNEERDVVLLNTSKTTLKNQSQSDTEIDVDGIMSGYSIDQQENEKENKLHSLQTDLKVEKEKYEREKSFLTSKIEELQDQIKDYEDMETQYHNLHSKNQKYELEKLTLENKIEQLENSQKQLNDHMNVKLFEINELLDSHNDLQNQYNLLHQNLLLLQGEALELKKKDEMLELEVEKDENMLHTLEDKVIILSNENESSNIKNTKYEQELNIVINITSKLDSDISKFENQSNICLENYVKRLNKLENYLLIFKQKYVVLNNSYKLIQQDKEQLENQLNLKNQLIETLNQDKTTNNVFKEKHDQLLEENKEIQEKLVNFNQQNVKISNLETEIKKLTNDLEQIRHEKNSIQNEVTKITQRNNTLEIENKRQTDTHIHLNHTIKSLNCIIQNKETEINDHQHRINQLTEKLNELNIRYNSGQQENDSLRQSIRKINTDINSLLKENNKYEYTTAELTKINQANELILQENKNIINTNTQLLNKKDGEISTLKHENEKLLEKIKKMLNESQNNDDNDQNNNNNNNGNGGNIGNGNNSNSNIDDNSSLLYQDGLLSPSRSTRNKRISTSSQSSLMSRSVGMLNDFDNVSETSERGYERKSFRKDKKNSITQLQSQSQLQSSYELTSPPPVTAPPPQVYYKGVPIEQLRAKTVHDSYDINSRNNLINNESQSRGTIIKNKNNKTNDNDNDPLSVLKSAYSTNGSMLVGLEGMKHMRKYNTQDYQKGTQINDPSAAAVAAVSNMKPYKDVLPSITRDLDGGVVLHENIEKILQKKIIDNEKNFIPFQTLSSTQSPQTIENSNSPILIQRKISNNKSYQPVNSSELEKKTISEKNEMIQRIIEDSYAQQKGSNQSQTIKLKFNLNEPEVNKSSQNSFSSDEETELTLSIDDEKNEKQKKKKKLTYAPKVTTTQIQQNSSRSSRQSSSSRNSDSNLQIDWNNTHKGNNNNNNSNKGNLRDQHEQSDTSSQSTSPPRKSNRKPLKLDPLHHKNPCSMCGMHFSGDGMKLPHSQDHLTFGSQQEIIFCSFDCARLWGRSKPYVPLHSTGLGGASVIPTSGQSFQL